MHAPTPTDDDARTPLSDDEREGLMMFGETWKWAGTYRRSDNNISPYAWHTVPVMVGELVDNTRARYIEALRSADNGDVSALRAFCRS